MNAEDQDELRIARQANLWLIRLEDEGRPSHAPCLEWLQESSRHVEAFLLASALSKHLRGLDPQRKIDVDALIRQCNDRVVAFPSERSNNTEPLGTTGRRSSRRLNFKRAGDWSPVSILLMIVAGIATVLAISSSQGAENYETRIGEQRNVKLSDGSFVFLNTDSQVRVRYTAAAREILLVRGEALFTAEHDLARPFRVSTDAAVINAVGTQFDVNRQRARTLIEVLRGSVKVSNETASATPVTKQEVRLEVGAHASVDQKGHISDNPENMQLAHNWLQRWLVFTNAPLAQIAAELNRYNPKQIVVEGQELNERTLSVDFNADSPQFLFKYLQKKDERVVVDEQGDKIVLRLRSQSPH